MSALSAVATAISDLDEEGYPVDDLGEALEAFAGLIEASQRLADSLTDGTDSRQPHLAVRAALARIKGGAA